MRPIPARHRVLSGEPETEEGAEKVTPDNDGGQERFEMSPRWATWIAWFLYAPYLGLATLGLFLLVLSVVGTVATALSPGPIGGLSALRNPLGIKGALNLSGSVEVPMFALTFAAADA